MQIKLFSQLNTEHGWQSSEGRLHTITSSPKILKGTISAQHTRRMFIIPQINAPKNVRFTMLTHKSNKSIQNIKNVIQMNKQKRNNVSFNYFAHKEHFIVEKNTQQIIKCLRVALNKIEKKNEHCYDSPHMKQNKRYLKSKRCFDSLSNITPQPAIIKISGCNKYNELLSQYSSRRNSCLTKQNKRNINSIKKSLAQRQEEMESLKKLITKKMSTIDAPCVNKCGIDMPDGFSQINDGNGKVSACIECNLSPKYSMSPIRAFGFNKRAIKKTI